MSDEDMESDILDDSIDNYDQKIGYGYDDGIANADETEEDEDWDTPWNDDFPPTVMPSSLDEIEDYDAMEEYEDSFDNNESNPESNP